MKNKRNIGRSFISFFLAVVLITCLFVVSTPIVLALEIAYSEGFESDDGGYTHTGTLDQWQWGTPTSGPGSAHSGSKCWATNLTGDVTRYVMSNSYLTSPAISIRALDANEIARVRFYGWIQIDEMFDRGEFQVSPDGTTWETKAEFFYIMQGTWTEYYFDVSDYAGGDIYLRFRLYVDVQEAFWIEKGGPPPYPSVNMAGWYIDDLAIEIAETPAIETTLTLEVWEDQYAYASCPWVYTWNGEEFVKDNDVYSTARGEAKEFTDYYTLNKPLVPKDGQYLLELRETEAESSYTDLVQLITIDHAAGVEVAADDNGNIWTYSSPSQPDSAVDDQGNNVLSEVATEDDTGFNGYNDDYIVLDFSSLDITNGATLVLSVQGFQTDSNGEGEPTLTRPWVHIQTQDTNGDWVTRNEFYPRMEWSTSAYDLSEYMATSQMVRLYITSCHEGKYHVIDYIGLDTSSQAPTTINVLSATSAVHSVNGDVIDSISTSDDSYASMTPLESTAFAFDAPALAGEVRDFVFISEGYYVPMGTFFIYTWDGTGWQQRDGWSQEGSTDQTETFDLSLWLPDTDGDYKVRIWQDYWYNGARIDYVGLTQGSTAGTLDTAQDLRNTANRGATGPIPWADSVVKTAVSASDNSYMLYPLEWATDYYYGTNGYPQRDRWLEVEWTGLIVNAPPTTNPVIITDETTPTPTISWTYGDADSDPQAQYEVEVWTGSGGTGTNVWDPAVGTGTGTSVVYAGSALTPGQTYYARVKAYDGTSWGAWSEASWTFPANQPPVANANGPYIGNEGSPIDFDATGSSDPDGDPLTYAWDLDDDGQYDDATGPTPSYTWDDDYTGTVSVEVSDGQATDTASTTVTVNNVAPTITSLAVTPAVVAVGETVTLDATFTDPGSDTHTADIDWDNDGTYDDTNIAVTSPISEPHSYADAGVYTVKLTVTDDDSGSDTEIFRYIVAYDPNAGFITGGGWIDSPAGAYTADPTLTGRANFGFVSKYKKGKTTPTGQTEFQFQVAGLNFHSSSYDWLVITNHKAMYKGVGTINGAGNYGFMLTAIDEKLTASTDVDMFRIKIWDKDNGDAIVYDNQIGDADDADPTTAIGGGQIVIHTK